MLFIFHFSRRFKNLHAKKGMFYFFLQTVFCSALYAYFITTTCLVFFSLLLKKKRKVDSSNESKLQLHRFLYLFLFFQIYHALLSLSNDLSLTLENNTSLISHLNYLTVGFFFRFPLQLFLDKVLDLYKSQYYIDTADSSTTDVRPFRLKPNRKRITYTAHTLTNRIYKTILPLTFINIYLR